MPETEDRVAQFRKMADDDPNNELGHFSAGMHLTLIILPAPGGDE